MRALLHAEFVTFARDKTALAFTFLFPVLFILVFGFLMGGEDQSRLGLVLNGVPGTKLVSVLEKTDGITVTSFPDRESLKEGIEKRRVDFGLVYDGKALVFVYDPTRVQDNYAFEQIARGISTRFNLARQGARPAVSVHAVAVRETSGNWFVRVVPGVIAFSILSAGLFAISGHLAMMKERRQLDRFLVTPMRPVSLLAAIAGVRLVVAYVSAFLTLLVAITALHLEFSVDWGRYALFVPAATIGAMGMGALIALVVRRPESAGNVSNIFAMLMMFLAGIYFPVEIMPSYLRAFSKLLPLTYMADAMRDITGVGEMPPSEFWGITAGLLVLGLVLLPLIARYIVRADRR